MPMVCEATVPEELSTGSADFTVFDIADFSSPDERLRIFHLGHTIRREISLPITPEERLKYSVSQLR